MRISIMQPYLLPYLGYWQLICASDEFIIFDDVNFIKRGWINRNNILLNGASHLFSLPVENPSQNKLINETYFIDDKKTKDNFLKTITLAYKKAPYFRQVFPLIQEIILNQETNIPKYIKYSLDTILNYLSLKKTIKYASNIKIDASLKGQDRILKLCKEENATTYINAIGGQELYEKDIFKMNGIDLFFIKMNDIKYKQFNNEFIPNLSIIDVLMFNSPEEIAKMLNNFTLI